MAKVRIQEVRKLLLPFETAVDAILDLDRSHGGTLANAKLLEARVETGADPALCLMVVQGVGDSAITVEKRYTLAAVAAAAIRYCSRARIPLPRHGTKSIEVVAEGFQLSIQVQSEVPRLHGPAPKISQVEIQASSSGKEPVAVTGDAALDDPTASDSNPASETADPASAAA
jgi:hypothetical protein